MNRNMIVSIHTEIAESKKVKETIRGWDEGLGQD